MEKYIFDDEEKLSPAVVVATLLLVLAFALGIVYQLLLYLI